MDEQIGSALSFDTEAEGLSILAEIFTYLGADVLSVTINQPLPDTVKAVVIAQPMDTLPVETVARLWVYLERGHNLLLAIDPLNYNSVSADRGNDTLFSLLNSDYGIDLQDTFLVERWSTQDFLSAGIEGSLIDVHASSTPHPVIDPLKRL